MKTKLIAMYLPQYHRIPENDRFWGDGFTDWVAVKKSEPQYNGHIQPKVPLMGYYDLSKKENVAWQAQLAKDNGIYGFGVYHYWFNNEQNLLTKPAEILRDNAEIDIHYFLAWDNGNWKRSWSSVDGNDWAPMAEGGKHSGPQILVPYILGREPDWERHFDYLLTHFKTDKYIKVENKPVFVIYQWSPELTEMNEYWNELARKHDFDGVKIIYRYRGYDNMPCTETCFFYEPEYAGWKNVPVIKRKWDRLLEKLHVSQGLTMYDYDRVWQYLLKNARCNPSKTALFGAFVNYDDTPRRGKNGRVIVNSTPEKFEKYLRQLIKISEAQGKQFVFLTAWNEWGEGAYLEPDEEYGYAYLDVIKRLTAM